jgi:hypothetical protein
MHNLKELLYLFRSSLIERQFGKLQPNQIVLCYFTDRLFRFLCLCAFLYGTETIGRILIENIVKILLFISSDLKRVRRLLLAPRHFSPRTLVPSAA